MSSYSAKVLPFLVLKLVSIGKPSCLRVYMIALNLKQPNIYQCSSISFMTKLPKELDFHKIIDYDVQFEKSFVEPLNFILQKINWLVDRSYGTQGTLEDFFN